MEFVYAYNSIPQDANKSISVVVNGIFWLAQYSILYFILERSCLTSKND
jgi:hypothetical protein